MIYKNKKEYDQALRDLNTALHEGAYRAKHEAETHTPENKDKTARHTQ